MKPLRILLAVRPRLLSDILRVLLEGDADVVVLDEVLDSRGVRKWARKYKVDVVLATIESTQDVPKLVTELLARFPRILVMGINMRQQRVRTYVLEVRTIPVTGILRAILDQADKGTESNGD